MASNGWRIVVYNDANEWDYIDNITTADERTFTYEELEQMSAVAKYQPSEERRSRKRRVRKWHSPFCAIPVKRRAEGIHAITLLKSPYRSQYRFELESGKACSQYLS
jgi:hypothetical protein